METLARRCGAATPCTAQAGGPVHCQHRLQSALIIASGSSSVPSRCFSSCTTRRRLCVLARALHNEPPDGQVQQIASAPTSLRLPDSPSQLTIQHTSRISTTPQVPGPGSVLAGGRYLVTGTLGAGANATTLQATRVADGVSVAIKALSLKAARDWKQLELFEREAKTLAALNHPGIPKYLDYFEEDSATDRSFFLVQEAVAGKSLAQLLSEGARCNTQEAERIAVSLCQVLAYLSNLHPPVVHRDVKPENIVLEGGAWGGRVFLVDFGGVAGAAASLDASAFATTVVGTYGYMAPEQFRGSAQPASDMYALGATLLFLLSGKAPFAFPQERMRINWRGDASRAGYTPPSPKWATLLDGLLDPVAEDRLTAAQALAVLQGAQPPTAAHTSSMLTRQQQAELSVPPMSLGEARQQQAMWLTQPRRAARPAGSRVVLERAGNRLDVTIPPKGLLSADTLSTGAFAIAWNAFVAFWTVGALAGGGILFALFSAPFWFAGVQLGRQAVGSALVKERLAIGANKWRLGQELAVFKDGAADFLGSSSSLPTTNGTERRGWLSRLRGSNEKTLEGATRDLRGARVITTAFINGQPQTAIEVVEGVRKHRFGEGLETEEQAWLAYEVNQHLEQLRGQPVDYASMPAPDAPQVYKDDDRYD